MSHYPRTYAVKGGWAAAGDGWAVHGPTKEQALGNYAVAEAFHRLLDARAISAKQSEIALVRT